MPRKLEQSGAAPLEQRLDLPVRAIRFFSLKTQGIGGGDHPIRQGLGSLGAGGGGQDGARFGRQSAPARQPFQGLAELGSGPSKAGEVV